MHLYVAFPCSIPSREGPSQAGNHPSTQADRQAVTQTGSQAVSHLPGDSTSPQAGSVVSPNNTPANEGPSQAGNNPLNSGGQAGRQLGTHLGAGPPRLPKGTVLPPGR